MEITTRTATVAGESGAMPLFVARPSAGGPYPAVIVVMEAFGLNAHIRSVCQRLAAAGYVAVSPDLYYREPKPVVTYDELPDAIRMMLKLWDSKILQDIDAVVHWLKDDAGVRADRIGMTGFCMGGRVTFLTACHNPAIKAAAPFYGGAIASIMKPGERTPKAPLDYAEQLSAPLLLFFGGKDAFIPPAEVEAIRTRLVALGKSAEVVVYEQADHGFFCDERPAYDAAAAGDAWRRLTEFFAAHLQD